MTIDDLRELQTPIGQRLLQVLAGEPLDDLLPLIDRYRKDYPAELVRAGVEQAQLRRKARVKFAQAEAMWFTREGLEMASSDAVASYTARRFAGFARVADLCCGIGGDALALAAVAGRVLAVDRDPLTLALARANAEVLGVRNLDFAQADVLDFVPTGLALTGVPEAIFIDPSRRESRHAARRPESYQPPLSWCLGLLQTVPRVGIKVSPAVDYEAALGYRPAEVEIISLRGECKEAMFWLGDFRTCERRASVLPSGDTLTEEGPTSDAVSEIGRWLFEPDPAVIRAHLIQRLAGACGLRRIDPEIAYLTGDAPVASPFLTGYPVTEVLPWNLKQLNVWLQAHHIGRVTIKKRGFPLTPDELRPKLKLKGKESAMLVCTKAQGKAVVVVCG